MENIKIENMLFDYGKTAECREISVEECKKIEDGIIKNFIKEDIKQSEILKSVLEKSKSIDRVDDDFLIERVIEKKGLEKMDNIYVMWDDLNHIDEISLKEFDSHIFDLWYEGLDNIQIFDAGMEWILFITRYGDVRILKK